MRTRTKCEIAKDAAELLRFFGKNKQKAAQFSCNLGKSAE
jgi:hypothetical protein